jgi:hypothetical protein
MFMMQDIRFGTCCKGIFSDLKKTERLEQAGQRAARLGADDPAFEPDPPFAGPASEFTTHRKRRRR